MPTALHTTTAAVLSFASALAAQTLVSGGPLAGSAVAFAIRGGLGAGADATTLVHRNGFVGAPAAFAGTAASGTLNLEEILAAAPLGAGREVDDFSTGRDDLMFDSNGIVLVPAFAWGMLTFSVKNGAAGAANSRLAAEVAEAAAMVPPQSVGAHVFSWILPGSSVPIPLRGAIHRSHSRRELGLPTTGTVNPEIDALDTPIVLGVDQAALDPMAMEPGFMPALIPMTQSIYFTLSSASAQLVPLSWFLENGVQTPRSGASILYVMKSSPQSQWTTPRVWKNCIELGLSIGEDIDALAIDIHGEKILFSCVGQSQPDQLMFLYYGTDGGAPVPAKLPNNQPVSTAIGTAQNDEVDAVCTLDPQVRTNGGWIPDDFGASCATPRDAYMPGTYPVGMSASAFRRYEGGNRHYDTWMLGFPPAAPNPGPGFAVLVITIGDFLSPAITATFQARVPASAIPGDPRSYTVDIPPVGYALVGLPLTFRWWAYDTGTGQLAQAYPVKAFL